MGRLSRLWRDERAAVAPLVGLSLFALIAAGGLAFDYARMATMDTELQNAADQAALAAATQLDGRDGAQARATAAANSLLRNTTLFANSYNAPTNDPTRITVPTVQFYESYDEATDVPGDVPSGATADEDSHVVIVTVGARRAQFAFTPVVGAIVSGDISAQAVASLSSSICQVPPLMICAPGPNFPAVTDVGKGILLEPGPQVGAWVPGNYGYLDFANGASGLATNLGSNNDAQVCIDGSGGIPTEPGNKASVTKALNSRFDLYPAGADACDPTTGNFCPAANVGKGLAITEESEAIGTEFVPPPNPGCGAAGAKIKGTDNSTDSHGFTLGAPPLGFPRDTCQINGTDCGQGSSKFGDGIWNRADYVAAEHSSTTLTAVAASIGKSAASLLRYDLYLWELADRSARMAARAIDVTPNPIPKKKIGSTGNYTYTFTNRCVYPRPKTGTGVETSLTQKDRRLLTVAVVDCTGANGKFDAQVLRFADIFLTEPSLDRTTANSPYATSKEQIYGEVVGVAKRPNGNSSFQYYLRQRARLLK